MLLLPPLMLVVDRGHGRVVQIPTRTMSPHTRGHGRDRTVRREQRPHVMCADGGGKKGALTHARCQFAGSERL